MIRYHTQISMNINTFYYITETARCGSINRAAQNLYTSQSNLSAAIKALEDEVGYALFERNSRGVKPTPEGYLFIQSANAIIAEINKINEIPTRISSDETISITCNWSALLLQALMDFKKNDKHEINDAYRETSLHQNFDCLYENKNRIAIIDCFSSFSDFEIQKARNTNLDVEVLQANVRAVAIMSARHPLAKKEAVSIHEVYRYPLVQFDDYRDQGRQQRMMLPENIPILYLYDRGGIIDAISRTNRIAIMKYGTLGDLTGTNLVEIRISDFPDSYDVLLLKRSYYTFNRREARFIRYIKDRVYSK